jgi:DNA-binding transcriptional LysR family regulator
MALDLAQWRLFLIAADHGSLLKAAEALHTDQPGLSRSLRRLEQEIGAPLFVRTSRGLTLTELGTRLRDAARDLVDQAAALESRAAAEARQERGVVRVGAVEVYPVTTAIALACQALIARGQAVATDVVGLPWLAHAGAVLDRTIDIGFTLIVDGRLPDATNLRSQVLWEEPLAFALISDRHPLAAADQIHPLELADLPLHLPNKSDVPDIYNLMLEVLADAGVPAPRRAPSSGTLANVIQHIAAGNGWMIAAHNHVRHGAPGTIAKPLVATLRRSVDFCLIWHVQADQTIVAAFNEKLRNTLTELL